jgi:hypothetical protein
MVQMVEAIVLIVIQRIATGKKLKVSALFGVSSGLRRTRSVMLSGHLPASIECLGGRSSTVRCSESESAAYT